MKRQLAFVLVAALAIAPCLAQEETPQAAPGIFISANLPAIALGTFQASLELPLGGPGALIVEGMYTDWKLGLMPKIMGAYIDFLESLVMEDLGEVKVALSSLNLIGYGGTLGYAHYNKPSGRSHPYIAGFASYYFFNYSMDLSAISGGSMPSSFSMPIHAGALGGKAGTKLVLGPVGLDLFVSVALTGAYMDMPGLINSLGLEPEMTDVFTSFMLGVGSLQIMPSVGFGFLFGLVL